ncbi:Hypothetical predicted protein [Olea europaea subsp. europaea]|uniref:Uncharacterized protein n=1 Tax=Olea europaea subsp. europaea TaxID=158383 RepID=A0A8S0PJT0_OLEEU|nr:Hypothetical predicted protein [Olea europaea subsp. europaea]
MKLDEDEYVIGTLSAEDRPQMMLDLVIERKFELSHDWKSGSVYFIGSIADDQIQDEQDFSDESDDRKIELRLLKMVEQQPMKRPSSPVSNKKAKLANPGNASVHIATLYPYGKAGKTPTGNKTK